eukprot:jgi/Chlat1/6195/Chrsp427S05726
MLRRVFVCTGGGPEWATKGGRKGGKLERHRSLLCAQRIHVLFVNETGQTLKLYWLDYAGQEVEYDTLEPAQEYRQQTFVTHPWRFISADGIKMLVDRRDTYFPAPEDTVVRIRNPEPLLWSRETHKRFPDGFKESTKTLLRVHHRLRHMAPAEQEKKKILARQQNAQKKAALFSTLPAEVVTVIIRHLAPIDLLDVLPPLPARG